MKIKTCKKHKEKMALIVWRGSFEHTCITCNYEAIAKARLKR